MFFCHAETCWLLLMHATRETSIKTLTTRAASMRRLMAQAEAKGEPPPPLCDEQPCSVSSPTSDEDAALQRLVAAVPANRVLYATLVDDHPRHSAADYADVELLMGEAPTLIGCVHTDPCTSAVLLLPATLHGARRADLHHLAGASSRLVHLPRARGSTSMLTNPLHARVASVRRDGRAAAHECRSWLKPPAGRVRSRRAAVRDAPRAVLSPRGSHRGRDGRAQARLGASATDLPALGSRDGGGHGAPGRRGRRGSAGRVGHAGEHKCRAARRRRWDVGMRKSGLILNNRLLLTDMN